MKWKTPSIETPRLILEPFDAEKHLTERYVSWLNDPAVVRFSEQRHRQHSLESCRAFAESLLETPNHFWAIVMKSPENVHIGNLIAYVDIKNKITELSILLGEQQSRGQGLATEAWLAAIKHAITVEGMRKVVAGTMSANTPMLSIFSRSGMCMECRHLRHFLLDGEEVDLISAAIFSEAYLRTIETNAG